MESLLSAQYIKTKQNNEKRNSKKCNGIFHQN